MTPTDNMKLPPVPGSSYNQRAKSRRHWLEKGKFLPAPFVTSQDAAIRVVRPTPYRPQVTVATINYIAAAAVYTVVNSRSCHLRIDYHVEDE